MHLPVLDCYASATPIAGSTLLEWVNLLSRVQILCFYCKQNKLHKNGSIWVESNASKWKGKCGRINPKGMRMQIVHNGFRHFYQSIANRLQRYKTISHSIIMNSSVCLSLSQYVCVLFTYIFFFPFVLPKIPRDFMLFYFERAQYTDLFRTKHSDNTEYANHSQIQSMLWLPIKAIEFQQQQQKTNNP